MSPTMSLISERTWKGRQGLFGEVIVRGWQGSRILRGRVERDSYDFQCRLVCEVWMNGQGWTGVCSRMIHEMPMVQKHSYTATDGLWERDIIDGCHLMIEYGCAVLGWDYERDIA